jgi:hypothetical protein
VCLQQWFKCYPRVDCSWNVYLLLRNFNIFDVCIYMYVCVCLYVCSSEVMKYNSDTYCKFFKYIASYDIQILPTCYIYIGDSEFIRGVNNKEAALLKMIDK